MKNILLALAVLPLATGVASAQTGDAAAGKTVWDRALCKNCHGETGEGAFGPDLAGRGLSPSQFKQAVRKPWGIMPAFVETQYNDKQLADMAAYFASMPKKEDPGKWRFEANANMAGGQKALVELGCAQCHGPTFNGPRGNLGAVNPDFDYFKGLVYNHTTELPKERAMLGGNPNGNILMGNYIPTRVTEASLREIYNWARDDIGWRAPLQSRLSKAEAAGSGVTYRLNVVNNGLPGKGLAAGGVTIRLVIPQGANVMAATGDGYKGAKMDEQAKAMVAEWQVANIGPKEQQAYSITLSKAGTEQDNVRGNIRWASPAPKMTKANDEVIIAPAPL